MELIISRFHIFVRSLSHNPWIECNCVKCFQWKKNRLHVVNFPSSSKKICTPVIICRPLVLPSRKMALMLQGKSDLQTLKTKETPVFDKPGNSPDLILMENWSLLEKANYDPNNFTLKDPEGGSEAS